MPETKMQPDLTPRIESRNAILIAGSQRHYTMENVKDIPSQWQSLPFGKIPGQAGYTAYGVCLNSKPDGSDFDYLAGAEVSDFDGLSAEFARLSVPAQKYAIFSHHGHISALKNTIDAIVKTWMPTARETLATPRPGEAQMIEFYGADFKPQTGLGQMEIWVPLKP